MYVLNKLKVLSIYRYLIFMLALLFLLSISRLFLSLWQFDRIAAVDGWLPVIFQGLRIDLATLCFLLFIPLLLSTLFPITLTSATSPIGRIRERSAQVWLTLIVCVLLFMELSTPSFINEYNIRPNRLFIEYLIYPKEVFSMLLKSHLPELINNIVLCSFASWYTWRWYSQPINRMITTSLPLRLISTVIVLFLVLIGGRSTLGHRPLNPAMVYFSTDPLVNSLILNSFYSTAFAAKEMLSEESLNYRYGKMDDSDVIKVVRNIKGLSKESIVNNDIPTLSEQTASYKGKPLNLVILLQESLGARFVGSLGGLPLTPSIDKLSKEGWFFKSVFATGTRSVRGIEATITGFTPTPDRAVVKLDKSQHQFFTIAELLRRKGYNTEFIYGGEAHFDNMKSFFLGNGFEHIVEEKDYQNPVFKGSWGVSDEDLLNKAHQRFEHYSQKNKPFFSLVFSSSNHTPFEYPADRIKPYDSEYHTRNNAIKYADWAIGEFFKKAKKSSYWDNTVFLIIADHDAKSQGTELVPPKSFHIPSLVIGKSIKPKIEHRIVSQLDMPVTMLSLIGIDNNNPMIGRDLTQLDQYKTNIAYMQYGQNFALLEDDEMTVLQPHKPALKYHFDLNTFKISQQSIPTKKQKRKALAVSIWGQLAYYNQLYRLPKE